MNNENIIKVPLSIIVVLSIVSLSLTMWYLNTTSLTTKVKSGSKILVCDIDGAYTRIPPKKIIGFNDQTGYWSFTNGYARNCSISNTIH